MTKQTIDITPNWKTSGECIMNDYEKLEAIHCAIQEALNGNSTELEQALVIVEQLREPHLKENV